MKELLMKAKDVFGIAYDEKDFEKAEVNVETKANEVMHTTNTGF